MDGAPNTPPAVSANASPYEAFLAYYSTHSDVNPFLASRVAAAYPSFPSAFLDPSLAVAHLQSHQQRWFTTASKEWEKIRGKIFTHLFTLENEYIYESKKTPGTWYLRDYDKIANILLVNKQLRREAMPFYHKLVNIDIGTCGPLVTASWFGNCTKLSGNIKKVQFRGWDLSKMAAGGDKIVPVQMVEKILERFPKLESMIIEAPEDGDHHTIVREHGGYLLPHEKEAQVPGFGGLIRSENFMRQLVEVDFDGIFEAGEKDEEARVREEFEAAVAVVLEKVEEARDKEAVKKVMVRLALPVDLHSELWLEWPAKKGERLVDLVVPMGGSEEEPHMLAMAVIDFEECVVEWRVQQHVVFVDRA